MRSFEISIVIPTWNGKELLAALLPKMLPVTRCYSKGAEVIVVDDGSTDGTSRFVQEMYPEVHLISSVKNEGFARACNRGASCAGGEIIFFLNNDVEVTERFLEPLAEHFRDPDVFAVRVNIVSQALQAKPRQKIRFFAEFRYGLLRLSHEFLSDSAQNVNECFAVGGSHGAILKEKFQQLGGFDDLYYPFYVEDIDLSYRALRRGWKILYEPESVIIHRGGGTIRRYFNPAYIDLVGERNRYLFIWKNISDWKLLLIHFLWIPLRTVLPLFKGDCLPLYSFLNAVTKYHEVFERREAERAHSLVSDREILNKFRRRSGR